MREQVLEVIEAYWQERRATVPMTTEQHNEEAARVADLKARVAKVFDGAPPSESGKITNEARDHKIEEG